MQSLIAATKNCAQMCGVLHKLGTVEQGKIADLIVVEEDPLVNISNIRKLKMVFRDGKSVNLTTDVGQASFWDLYFKQKQNPSMVAQRIIIYFFLAECGGTNETEEIIRRIYNIGRLVSHTIIRDKY